MTDVHRRPVDQSDRDRIRDAHHRTLFVEAGAGTGKTTALVARVVDMVALGWLPQMQGIAAITFTENAAAELRNRIRDALEVAARGAFGGRRYDAEQTARCSVALRQLDDASITTLHGFAARILSDVALDAGLPPGFAVSDAISSQLDATRAWRGFLDDLLDDPTVTAYVLAALTLDRTLDRLRTIAAAFAANWDLLVGTPFAVHPLPPIDATPVLDPLRRAASAADAGPSDDKLTDYLRSTVRPAVSELTSLQDPLDVLEAIHRLELKTNCGAAAAWAAVGMPKSEVIDALQEAKNARNALIAAVGASVTETLCARIQEFTLSEAARRRREGRLDFHDLLVLTRDVLRTNSDVRRQLHDRYHVLLIDEFQDTDPLQVEIACLIAGNCADEPPAEWSTIEIPPGRLFFVGDPKQSIYRFRRADVGLFAEVGTRHHSGHTRLEVNFRSVPEILAAVNTVFTDLIRGAGAGQVSYTDLRASREPASGPAPVTLLGGPEALGAAELREREAQHIAAAIRTIKAEHRHVARDQSEHRPPHASYADIAILLPTRTSLPAIEDALQHADIPYRVESRSLVWATDAVRDVVTLLQAVAHPADEVATVAALRHHGLACSDVDLVTWATAGGRWNYLSPQLPVGITREHPVAAGMAALHQWHDLRWWIPVNELVDRVVRELRLVELTAELRRPRDHWRRLRFLIDQARAFCDAGGAGLSDFVAWAVDQIESEADTLETVVPEPDDDAVRILTVHGSKGLEFPVTIVAGLGVGPRSDADVLWGGTHPQVRLKAGVLETSSYQSQQATEKALDHAESIRLLYVAMTRAKDFLLLGCYHKPTKTGYGSHGQQLWRLLAQSPLATVEPAPPVVGALDTPVAEPFVVGDRIAARDAREALLADLRSRVATSATSLVAAAEGPVPVLTETRSQPDAPPKLDDTKAATRRRSARTGAAIGTAVHHVLELISFAHPGEEIQRLTEAICEDQAIPMLVSDIAARVRNAVTTPIVTAAGATGRCWREVYIIHRYAGRYLEGYIDLLVESDGSLVVVDYKTDRATTESERTAKAQHYQPQLQAYADALRALESRTVQSGTLLFLSPDTATPLNLDLR